MFQNTLINSTHVWDRALEIEEERKMNLRLGDYRDMAFEAPPTPEKRTIVYAKKSAQLKDEEPCYCGCPQQVQSA